MKHPIRRLFFRRRKHSLRACALFFILSTAFLSVFLIGHALLTPPQTSSIPSFSEGTQEEDTKANAPALSRTEGVYTCLILGTDHVGNNTDVIMLSSFDVTKGKISVLQLPRDTYFSYRENGIKLGTLYSRLLSDANKAGAQSPVQTAMSSLCDLLQTHLALPIDYYVLIDLNAVRETVDAIGGITIDVPCDMEYDDPEQGLSIHLKQGKQTLDGEKALQFLRFRSGYVTADIGRLDAQKLFVSALFQAVKRPQALPGLIAQAPSLLKRVQTNAGLSDALYFLGKIGNVSADKLTLATATGEAIRVNDGTWYYVLNRASMLEDLRNTVSPFTTPLPDDKFDENGVFTDPSDPLIEQIYRRPMQEFKDNQHTAADLIENGVQITASPTKQ